MKKGPSILPGIRAEDERQQTVFILFSHRIFIHRMMDEPNSISAAAFCEYEQELQEVEHRPTHSHCSWRAVLPHRCFHLISHFNHFNRFSISKIWSPLCWLLFICESIISEHRFSFSFSIEWNMELTGEWIYLSLKMEFPQKKTNTFDVRHFK